MTYTPTENELEELWFVWDSKLWLFINWVIWVKLWNYYSRDNQDWKFFIWWEIDVYPQSKQDIETLIRLFTTP